MELVAQLRAALAGNETLVAGALGALVLAYAANWTKLPEVRRARCPGGEAAPLSLSPPAHAHSRCCRPGGTPRLPQDYTLEMPADIGKKAEAVTFPEYKVSLPHRGVPPSALASTARAHGRNAAAAPFPIPHHCPPLQLHDSILITGGCGFLGQHLVDALLTQKGACVRQRAAGDVPPLRMVGSAHTHGRARARAHRTHNNPCACSPLHTNAAPPARPPARPRPHPRRRQEGRRV